MNDLKDKLESICDACYHDWLCETRLAHKRCSAYNDLVKLIELNTPVTFNLEGDGYADGQMVYDTLICPNCGKEYEVGYEDDFKYCPNCGQARKVDDNDE